MRSLSYDGMCSIKVLALEGWMTWEWCKEDLDKLEPIVPVFNRNGYYYNRKLDVCWFEVDGKAYIVEKDMFLYDLEGLNISNLNHKQVAALQAICDQDLATKEQRHMLHRYVAMMMSRNTYRNSRMYLHRIIKNRKGSTNED